jgi:CheY-like chemotaxis protein
VTHLMVVDDDPNGRTLARRVLEDKGFTTSEAGDEPSAVAAIRSRRPDLVLVDVDKPGLDGWSLLERLPSLPDPPPVVFLSGPLEFATFARGARSGVSAFVAKPLHFGKLVTTCRRILLARERASRPPDERRATQRLQLLVAVTVESGGVSTTVLGELADLSLGGARVILLGPVQVGSAIRLTLDRTVAGRLAIEGEVRWCSPAHDGFAHGLSFRGLTPDVLRRIRLVVGESA